MNNPLSGTDPTGYVACSKVSTDQKDSSGSCEQGGKTINYSFNGNGDLGVASRAGAASAAVSTGVLWDNPTKIDSREGFLQVSTLQANGATRVQTWASDPAGRERNGGQAYTDRINSPADRGPIPLGSPPTTPISARLGQCAEPGCGPVPPVPILPGGGAINAVYPELFVPWNMVARGVASASASIYGRLTWAQAANNAGRTFYTVQNEANAARLLSGGTPWPTSASRAHLGEGLYTWGSRSQAEAYMSLLEGRGVLGLRIMEAYIPEAQYNALRLMDLRVLGDDAANAWLVQHSSLFGEGASYGLDHVIRNTGNFGAEFFFSRHAYSLLRIK